MQLIHAPASPFARKVRVLASETGLLPRLDLIDTAVLPVTLNGLVNDNNPLGKVPVMITDDGQALFDSRVICEYLDSLHDQPRLFPAEGPYRWTTLRLAALADGLMEAALLVRYERAVRPGEHQWDAWIEGQTGKIQRAVQSLEEHASELNGPLTIAHITVGCALGYLDFRFGDQHWRHNAPKLAQFQEKFAARESMVTSCPI